MSKRKTQEQFVSDLKSVNPNIIVEGQYVNNHSLMLCHCKKCGNSWYARPNSLLRGYGCPNCAGNVKKSDSVFRRELHMISPEIEPLECYKGNKVKILCRCKKCGNEWKITPNNLLSKKQKCPVCSHNKRGLDRRKTNEEFIKELSLINPTIKPLETYTTSQKKIKCQCGICGFVWSATPNNLLDKNSRCPECSHASTSKVEQILLLAFETALGKPSVLSRDKKAIGKELDVYIPSLHLAIEFGAWYWHKKRLKHDNEKQKLCNEKGIKLITILEDCPKKIEQKLSGNYQLYQSEISEEKDFVTVKNILKAICSEYKVSFIEIENNWEKIIRDAIEKSQKKTDKDFRNTLSDISPTIKLLDSYTRSNIKMRCKCELCGNEWLALPTSLLRGHGCPKCARIIAANNRTISNEEFLDRLSIINNSIEPIDPYKRGNEQIRCKCKKCGNEWMVKPHNLLSGNGCPKCGRIDGAKKQSKPIRCIETGVCYESVADAFRKTGISNTHKCAKGYQKTAGGFHWEYVEINDST